MFGKFFVLQYLGGHLNPVKLWETAIRQMIEIAPVE